MELVFENVVSPAKEVHSYETILGAPNVTLKQVADWYSRYHVLPSQLLEYVRQEIVFDLDGLKREVTDFFQRLQLCFSVLIHGTFQYPERLREARHPLELLYFRGDLGLLDSPCVSIVGARKCSAPGAKRATQLARQLVDADFTIVSGLAEGIDTAAMQAAIDARGRTIGVIGTSLAHVYPRQSAELQETVARNHLLLSQVPFYRYENEIWKTRRFYFPQRNETMAALSYATIIVEASETSGTHTQARACLQQGRKLFILNSCFESGLKWPFAYEKQGAIRVREIDDIVRPLEAIRDERPRESGVEEV